MYLFLLEVGRGPLKSMLILSMVGWNVLIGQKEGDENSVLTYRKQSFS